MGLDISVGQLAYLIQHDPEAVEWERDSLRRVNRVLVANGLPPHREPEALAEVIDRSPFAGMPYGWLHHVRRAVAYALHPGPEFRPLRNGEQPEDDERYDSALSSFASHVVCHSDCEGYYVPVDFPEPLYDDLPDGDPECIEGGMLGSSQGGLRELRLAAPLLDIPLTAGEITEADMKRVYDDSDGGHPHTIARLAWLYLFERLRQSVDYGSAARFG